MRGQASGGPSSRAWISRRKVVIADGGKEFPYDHLILALGSQPNFFGVPGVKEHSLALGGLADALRIRNRVIERFEQATLDPVEPPDPRLTFVVIGGGSTGVETAAEIHALVHEALAPDFPNIDVDEVGSSSSRRSRRSSPSSTPPCGGRPARSSRPGASR